LFFPLGGLAIGFSPFSPPWNGRNLRPNRQYLASIALSEDFMPGSRPTPVPLKLLRGNPGKRPLKRGFEPPQPPLPPDPPKFLTGDALEEWHRIAAGLHLFGLLTKVDVSPLAAYCVS
jgi:hypothetical protein